MQLGSRERPLAWLISAKTGSAIDSAVHFCQPSAYVGQPTSHHWTHEADAVSARFVESRFISVSASRSRPRSPSARPREMLARISFSEKRCPATFRGFALRLRGRARGRRAGCARPKSCSGQRLWSRVVRDLAPGKELLNHVQAIDPDKPRNHKPQHASSSEATGAPPYAGYRGFSPRKCDGFLKVLPDE
jgi:hypothetical protein